VPNSFHRGIDFNILFLAASIGKFFTLSHGKSPHWWQPFNPFFCAHALIGQILVNWKVFSDMHPSQAMFSGEVPKKGASPSLSFWSLFLSAARTEHTLQYMPHGDRYSFFTPIFSSPLFIFLMRWQMAILLLFAYMICAVACCGKQSRILAYAIKHLIINQKHGNKQQQIDVIHACQGNAPPG